MMTLLVFSSGRLPSPTVELCEDDDESVVSSGPDSKKMKLTGTGDYYCTAPLFWRINASTYMHLTHAGSRRASKYSVIDLLTDKYEKEASFREREASLKEKELELRKMELQLQERKLALEEEERKRRGRRGWS